MTEILNEFWGLILIVIGVEMLACNLLNPEHTHYEIGPEPAPPDNHYEWLQFVYEWYANALSRPVRQLSDQDKRAAVRRWIQDNSAIVNSGE